MADNRVIFEVIATAKGVKVVQKDTENLAKSTDKADRSTEKLRKSRDKYSRTEKGVAGISSNSTKNFSKMQQSIDGGGGSGGLVRAYALLAANIFALTAAFGVLSRAAQIDTLSQSIERLEVVSGKSVKAVARDLQAASGFSLDFANSLRSTSLALSAGFDASQIAQLGEVAKNAAVSLGRPLADSLDRIFRGVIKVEPELLDEIGLFVRVDEAASKYADSLGIASSELTDLQKRTAFANEALDQGTKKFAAFASVEPDAFAILGATLADTAQSALAFINKGLVPILQFFQENKPLLIGAFAGIAITLLKSIIPAMGLFRQSARQAAQDARENFNNFKGDLETTAKVQKENAITAKKLARETAKSELKAAEAARAKIPAYTQGGKALEKANEALDNAKTKEEKLDAIRQKRLAFNKSLKASNKETILEQQAALLAEEQALERVIEAERDLKNTRQRKITVQPGEGSFLELEGIRLAKVELRALALENVATTASAEGLRAGFARLKLEEQELAANTAAVGGTFGFLDKIMFKLSGTTTILSIKISELMLKFSRWFPLISIIIAVFPALLNFLGFANESSKKYGEASDKASELLGNFSEKLQTARDTIIDTTSSYTAITDASLAFKRAIQEIGQTLTEQKEAYREYLVSTNAFVRFFEDFGASGARKIVENEVQAIGDILKNFEGSSIELQELIQGEVDAKAIKEIGDLRKQEIAQEEKLDRILEKRTALISQARAGVAQVVDENGNLLNIGAAININEREQAKAIDDLKNTRKEMNTVVYATNGLIGEENSLLKRAGILSKEQADALEVGKAALDEAKDAAREFKKQYITKSDVDKPLASFRAITANLGFQNEKGEKINLSTKDREDLLNRIKNSETDIFDIMSLENRTAYEAAKTDEERLRILELQEQEYAKAKVTLTLTKQLLSDIANQQKLIANLAKETAVGVERKFELEKQSRQLNTTLLEVNQKNQLIAAKLTKDQVTYLAGLDVNADLLKEIAKFTTKEGEALSAIINERALNLELLKAEIAEKTETNRKEIELNKILQTRINAQEKLNSLNLENFKLSAELQSAAAGKGTSLDPRDNLSVLIEGENQRLKTAKEKAQVEKDIIKAQFAILKAELKVLNDKKAFAGIEDFNLQQTISDLDKASETLVAAVDKGLENASTKFIVDLVKGFESANLANAISIDAPAGNKNFTSFIQKLQLGGDTLIALRKNKAIVEAEYKSLSKQLTDELSKPLKEMDIALVSKLDMELAKVANTLEEIAAAIKAVTVSLATAALDNFASQVMELGPGGKLAASLAHFSSQLITVSTTAASIFQSGASSAEKFVAAMAVVSTVIAGVSSALQADADRRVANVDQAIELEKRLDGKSAESVAKIKAMEAKKEAIQRKAFETNKKLQIAQAIISTAAGAAAALAIPIVGPALAAIITALGMYQVALIRKTSYQGGSSDLQAPQTALNIGSRANAVDVSQRATGGELNYLRGGRTTGGDLGGAGGYLPGGAMGRKGYANGGEGILVGERGPEIVSPSMPVDITPNYALGGQPTNVNFNINAVDAAGVEDVLMNQRGNIIRMIREAANENGERFLETIDTQSYGSRT